MLPLERRKILAKNKIWGKKDFNPENYKNMIFAIDEYIGLIFDHNRHDRDMLLEKLNLLNNQLVTEIDTFKINNLLKAINSIENRIDEIDMKIDRDEQVIILKGNRKLSMIEEYMANRKAYEERMKNVIGQD